MNDHTLPHTYHHGQYLTRQDRIDRNILRDYARKLGGGRDVKERLMAIYLQDGLLAAVETAERWMQS